MYLLDTNVFIFAQRDYYPLERIPEFWDWLAFHADAGEIKVPSAIWEEIKAHDEELHAWMKRHKDSLILSPDESDILIPSVLETYASDLTEAEVEQIGPDAFLIAAVLHYEATIVSKEGSKPSKKRQNRRVPDICRDLDVQCITDHKLIAELNFSTSWRSV